MYDIGIKQRRQRVIRVKSGVNIIFNKQRRKYQSGISHQASIAGSGMAKQPENIKWRSSVSYGAS